MPVVSICHTCKKTADDIKRCGKCHSRTYCSIECQRKDWKEHKKGCKDVDKDEYETVIQIIKRMSSSIDGMKVQSNAALASRVGHTSSLIFKTVDEAKKALLLPDHQLHDMVQCNSNSTDDLYIKKVHGLFVQVGDYSATAEPKNGYKDEIRMRYMLRYGRDSTYDEQRGKTAGIVFKTLYEERAKQSHTADEHRKIVAFIAKVMIESDEGVIDSDKMGQFVRGETDEIKIDTKSYLITARGIMV